MGAAQVTKLSPDRREPLVYGSGKVQWSRAFQDSRPVQAMLPFLKGPKTRTVAPDDDPEFLRKLAERLRNEGDEKPND